MNLRSLSLFSFPFIALCFTVANAATFNIRNNCPYTVWAAAVPGGGRQLGRGGTWNLNVNVGTTGAPYGAPPNTLAEFALNQYNNLDFFDISLVDGFNVPMEFSPTSGSCSRGIRCVADIIGQCPNELKAPGGCNNPCTVYKTDQYCCNSGSCSATDFSRFFKKRCPDAYSYPKDDQTSTFTCPGGTNYRVVFCP
ncbi:hypothetical protein V6N11_064042 [Hibiscus sabdariffa]|uniref:Thaumatin-like protein n=1 Tax=Hibiscus sabdariffa TaxID=183260 RepID=A0ABR2PMI9_9ROSI